MPHTPLQQYKEACQIAKDHNMFVVDKPGKYLVYRQMPDRNILLGSCKTVETLRRKVSRYADFR